MSSITSVEVCMTCNGTRPDLKYCAKGKKTPYCSQKCQKEDWKTHKIVCGIDTKSTPAINGLIKSIEKPFTALDKRIWLHKDRPEGDVYKLLIDSFRMYAEETLKFDGNLDSDGVYNGAPNSLEPFRRFVKEVTKHSGLLPPWWSADKMKACEEIGLHHRFSNLRSRVEKSDMMQHYGDDLMPMQMRMFAEQVLGRGPGGMSGRGMLQMQVMKETTPSLFPYTAHISIV